MKVYSDVLTFTLFRPFLMKNDRSNFALSGTNISIGSLAFALTAVTGIVFERHGAHDASSGRKAHLHHVVLYDDLLRRSVLGRGEEITQHGHFACQTSRIGRRRTERLHDRRCGHGRRIGDDGLRQFGMGRLISGQLLLIFLLLPGTVNRETEKQNPDKYDAYD